MFNANCMYKKRDAAFLQHLAQVSLCRSRQKIYFFFIELMKRR